MWLVYVLPNRKCLTTRLILSYRNPCVEIAFEPTQTMTYHTSITYTHTSTQMHTHTRIQAYAHTHMRAHAHTYMQRTDIYVVNTVVTRVFFL